MNLHSAFASETTLLVQVYTPCTRKNNTCIHAKAMGWPSLLPIKSGFDYNCSESINSMKLIVYDIEIVTNNMDLLSDSQIILMIFIFCEYDV